MLTQTIAPVPVLKVSQYPLPADEFRTMADRCRYILVVEDGQPFVEEQVKALLSSRLYGERVV